MKLGTGEQLSLEERAGLLALAAVGIIPVGKVLKIGNSAVKIAKASAKTSLALNSLRKAEVARIWKILKPDGIKRVGKAGSSSRIRVLYGGLQEAEKYLSMLTKDKSYSRRVLREGKVEIYDIPCGGGYITFRKVSKSGPPTVDIRIAGEKGYKLKFVEQIWLQ